MNPDKREHPRVSTTLPVEVELPDGQVFHTEAVNASRAGVQLACSEHLRARLFPGGQPLAPDARPVLRLRMNLPTHLDERVPDERAPDRPQTLATGASGGAAEGARRCRVEAEAEAVIFRRVGENDYRVGVQFRNFHAEGFSALERFIYDQVGGKE